MRVKRFNEKISGEELEMVIGAKNTIYKMKYIKEFENKENPKFKEGDIVYMYKKLDGPLEYGKPYVIKLCNLNFPSVYYQLEGTDLNYNFPEFMFISEEEYLEKIADKYNL